MTLKLLLDNEAFALGQSTLSRSSKTLFWKGTIFHSYQGHSL